MNTFNLKMHLFFYFSICMTTLITYPDSKVHVLNMGHTRGRQDPGGPHVGPMNLAIWVGTSAFISIISTSLKFMRYLVQGLVIICLRTRMDRILMDILRFFPFAHHCLFCNCLHYFVTSMLIIVQLFKMVWNCHYVLQLCQQEPMCNIIRIIIL